MMDSDLILTQMNQYSDLFDLYIEQDRPPSHPTPEGKLDPLLDYLQEEVADQYNFRLAKCDSIWRDVFKSSLLSFFETMLKSFLPLDKEQQKEFELIEAFFSSNIEQKQWREVILHIQNKYSAEELNICRIISQYQEAPTEQREYILEAMRQLWIHVSQEKLLKAKRNLLLNAKKHFHALLKEAGNKDYAIISSLQQLFYNYPLLKDIVEIIGREKPYSNEEKDSTTNKYRPIHLTHAKSITEVDGITLGNIIQNALHSELVYLSDSKTKDIFYNRFVTYQLQLLASKPPMIMQERDEHVIKEKPRLIKGPIIVSIDTSSSMDGIPSQIARSLLLQLLQMAKQQKRACYLITYSVRAQAIDLAHPGNWQKVKQFLQGGFTGGTYVDHMLHMVFEALELELYHMADILLISDFLCSRPRKDTLSLVQQMKQSGTKFYGLGIKADRLKNRHNWLDKSWNITYF